VQVGEIQANQRDAERVLDAVPPAPRVPSERAKRMLFKYQGGAKVMLILGIVFTLTGLPFVLIFCRALPGQIALALSSRETPASVTAPELQTNVSVNGRNPTLIAFTYELDGETYEGECSTLDSAVIRRAQGALGGLMITRKTGETDGVGAATEQVPLTLTARYSPLNPRWAALAGTSYGFFPPWTAFVLLFPGIGLLMLIVTHRAHKRQRVAFVRGSVTLGEVTEAGYDLNTTMNGRHPFRVRWQFEALGQRYTGKLSNMDSAELAEFPAGQAVAVLYEPENPKRNTLWIR